jgi:hypothetical protein
LDASFACCEKTNEIGLKPSADLVSSSTSQRSVSAGS